MATNPPSGDGHRNGAVKGRSQILNPKTGLYTKRNTENGQFMDVRQESEAGFPAPLFLLLLIFPKGGNHGQIPVLRKEYQPAAGH